MPLAPYALALAIFAAGALDAISTPPANAASKRVSQAVDRYVQQQMSKYCIPGLALAVVKNGEVVKLRGYGLASVEFDIPADTRTVFQIYSTSKVFAGVAVMKLVEDGKLTLDTAVTDVIDGLPPAWSAIRVRHLLSHTSGLPGWRENPRSAGLSEEKKQTLSGEEQIRLVAELPLKFAPGEKFAYHQSGYTLLAMIVAQRAGKPFWKFVEERVFAPLGMTDTRWGDTEVVIARRPATAYNRQSGELRNWVYLFGRDGTPASGLNASIADLSRFLIALDSTAMLRRESLEALWTPARLNDGTKVEYGLGWSLDEHRGRQVAGHEGGGAAWIAHLPTERLSIAVLCNLNGARADEIQYGIADLYLEPAAR
jgi:CubicO group peptidase (beta-lactamase class C family)